VELPQASSDTLMAQDARGGKISAALTQCYSVELHDTVMSAKKLFFVPMTLLPLLLPRVCYQHEVKRGINTSKPTFHAQISKPILGAIAPGPTVAAFLAMVCGKYIRWLLAFRCSS
jgi:hypothetical protein